MNSALATRGIFEVASPGSEPGPLTFEKPSGRFGRLLPGTLGCLQRGGAGVEVSTAAAASEEPAVGIFGTPEVLLVGSPGKAEILVTSPDGRVCPPSGAGPEIGEVPFEIGLLLAHLGELVGDGSRDGPDEFAVLGAQCLEALGGSSLVRCPLLASLVIPGPDEALPSLGEV